MNFRLYHFLTFIFLCAISFAQPKIKLDTFARGFTSPIDIAHDGFTSRVFAAQQNGIIWTLDSNGVKLDTFLDIRAKVQNGGEEGLLGLTFHPDFKNNGYFYTYYTKKNTTDNAVYRYKVSGNPNRALKDSELLVINLLHPTFTNHNGGCIKFGNDGYLYIAVGDGGSGGDPNGNGQNKNTFLGKILRLNVNNFSIAYTVPASNPFVGQSNVKTEIWAYGLRNPWRFSFDRQSKDLWIGDVGQGSREEVDFQAVNSTGGENYGWRCYEGNSAYNTSGCGNASNYKFPVFEYDHSGSGGVAITGGFVYRGNKYNDFKGYYICADYTSSNFWAIKKDGNTFTNYALGKPLTGIYMSSFGEDIRGELYATNILNGVIYKIRELCSSFQLNLVKKKNPSCPNISNGSIEMTSIGSNGAVTYNWSNSGNSNVISNLAPNKYLVTATDGIGCVRKDSFTLVNHDTLRIGLLNKKNPSCPNINNGQISIQALDGFGPVTFNWSNGGNTAAILNLAPNKYVITSTDSVGCSAKDSFILVNQDTLRLTLLSKQNPSCPNVSNGRISVQALDGFGPVSYNWNNGGTTSAILNLAPNKYIVTATDSVGCSAKDSIVLFNADTLDKPIITLSNDTLYTTSGFSYQWKLNTIDIIGAFQVFHKALSAGLYQVEITDANGCKAISDTIRFVITSVRNKDSGLEKFSVFPNPAKDNLTVDILFNTVKKSTLKIINSIGQVIYTEQLTGKELLKTISLQSFPIGIYQLFIQTEDGQISSQSFVKE